MFRLSRVALEGYPGLLARELIGRRSYKSDLVAGQTVERREARADLLAALVLHHPPKGWAPKDWVQPKAIVQTEDPSLWGPDLEAELLALCTANLARYKVPREIEFLDELPRNAMGKVVKPEVAKLFA